MNFIFAEKKLNLSDELKDYARKKLSKLDKYFKTDSTVHLTPRLERGFHLLEVTVKHDHMLFRSSEKSNDMYAAIDSAVASIDRQIRKNKTRLEKRLRAGAFDKEAAAYSNNTGGADPIEEEHEFKIIRTKRFSVKPMTPEEAILQMNLLGHNFFVFKSMENEKLFSLVYKRSDGGYGLIEND